MEPTPELTPRENQIAGLISTGLAKKEVADLLKISTGTVETTVKHIYEKTGLGKMNELTAWWLIKYLKLNVDLNDMRRSIMAFGLLLLFVFDLTFHSDDMLMRHRRSRRQENEIEIIA
jgi:DNA-binding CsgD family transcriptional regulator